MGELSLDQKPEGWSRFARTYDNSFASFTALFAQEALRLTNVRQGLRVIDVGAGTGALALLAAEAGAEVLAVDFSIGMIDFLNSKINQIGLKHITAMVMDGQAMDVENDSFDAAFSIFGLCFFPDRVAGFRELHRVIKPGGLAAVVNWCSLEHSEFLKLFVGAIMAVDPNMPLPKTPPPGLSLGDPELFKTEMMTGGFDRVNLFTVRHIWTFSDPEFAYDSTVGILPAFTQRIEALDREKREAFRLAIINAIRQRQGDGPYGLEGQAHIAVGKK
ncbi:MAG TPA: class I SAM-dependent methyltransferase [Thermodesulfobacteriota bacterium]|nr:class I SAM-dependent methyltransferase [Thermodesulfobacteriota bacterium]